MPPEVPSLAQVLEVSCLHNGFDGSFELISNIKFTLG